MSAELQYASLLAHVEELQRRDDAVAAGIEGVAGLLGRADSVRERAAAVLGALEAVPAELAYIHQAAEEGSRREAHARDELVAAEQRMEEASSSRRGGAEARDQAQRELARAREQLVDAGAEVARIAARRARVLDSERALRAEAEGLAVTAGDVAAEIRAIPRVSASGREEPGAGLPGLVEWGARVRAALFVVRGLLETERERIVVEAEMLGSAVLGEQLGGSSVALVRRRLEAHLRE